MFEKEDMFPAGFFDREDEGDDAQFWGMPRANRFVDEAGQTTLAALYRELVPEDGLVLDLMAGWESHLSADATGELFGLGLNSAELAANPRLAERVIHDLNRDPALPYPEAYFDAVLCAGSIEYVIHPLAVFSEANRILKAGGPLIVSFSERSYAAKVLSGWKLLNAAQRVALVASYFTLTGNWDAPNTRFKVLPDSDPLFMVWAHKQADF
ncbi:MAG: class I SAM-dependent methyltransferase [Anaerolineae bacterium]|nr:class I SAM-dependent methyltransferase [Anaerolineae bacterium]